MAKAIVTFKIMPDSPDAQIEVIREKAEKIARARGAIGQMQTKIEPFAFGLKAILVLGMYDVDTSDFDAIAQEMSAIEEVQSAEVAKMDLALG